MGVGFAISMTAVVAAEPRGEQDLKSTPLGGMGLRRLRVLGAVGVYGSGFSF